MGNKTQQISNVPFRQVRATYTNSTIIVYQAYNETIAKAAINNQTFTVPQFNPDRMTWIKPSFRWMLYRSGWAQKPNQEHILAIHLTRDGWEQALKWSGTREDGACVRIQWDPERGLNFEPLEWRSIQVGLSGQAVKEGFLGGRIAKIEDVTEVAKKIGELVAKGNLGEAEGLLPTEKEYEFLDDSARNASGAS
jgi:pre-mRNA-splicing factor ATP-dependent RNA helicase DHX16